VADRRPRRPRAQRRSPSLLYSGIETARGARSHRLAVDVSSEGVRSPLGAERAREIVRRTLRRSKVRDAMISVTFASKRAMAKLNREHLGHAGPTDVITFAMGATGPHGAIVADIYISPDVARESAREFGVGVREELARLVVHGTLHALGRTHPEGRGRAESTMWREQEAVMRDVH
jgi:probable rRNA maturation factor